MKKLVNFLKRHPIGSSVTVLVLAASMLIPLPYYIFSPGSAEAVAPRVTVVGGHKDEKGELMLTTVMTTPVSNMYVWIYGRFLKDAEFMPKKKVDGGIPSADYAKVLTWMMENSQTDAKIAAMRYLGKPVQIEFTGVEIGTFTPESKARDFVQSGDVIVAVDGHPVKTTADLQSFLAGKRPGDRVSVTAVRSSRKFQVAVPLVGLSDGQTGKPVRAGIGFQPLQLKKAVFPQEVDFKTEDIGGPSAGLMFSLEIISQLTPGDLTHGYKIAGTGTISPDGTVGQIGGIEHKIVAATRAHADYFFVPKDRAPGDTNEKLATQQARKINSPLKIIPVGSLDEAMQFLKALH